VALLCSFPPTFANHLVVSSWLSSIIQELGPRFAAGSEQEGQLPLSRASLLQKSIEHRLGFQPLSDGRWHLTLPSGIKLSIGSWLEYSQPQPEAGATQLLLFYEGRLVL
jgi:hypothetical protein